MLTLEDLDRWAGKCGPDTCTIPAAIHSALIEYARERAAREACGKLLTPGESIELNYDPEEEDAECVAVRLDEGGFRDNADHVAHAGADAYLALMVALERQAGEEA